MVKDRETTWAHPYLSINKDRREIRYLGYILPLSVGEYKVLEAIIDLGVADKNEIKSHVPNCLKLSKASVSVHVCSINKKALALDGRKLVLWNKGVGYKLNKII